MDKWNQPEPNLVNMLQWSRFFSKRKIGLALLEGIFSARASMEPLFFKAENLTSWKTPASEAFASMEPLFFKAENNQVLPECVTRDKASMEPLFFKAENNAWLALWPSYSVGFNGAAFFQSGKF